MDPLIYRKTHILMMVLTGVGIVILSAVVVSLGGVHQQRISSSQQPFQKTAQTVLGCLDYDSILSANYNQQLGMGYSTMSQITTRLPGQNQALFNYEYNAIASDAYSLYTGSLNNANCTPSVSAPAPVSPASAPDYTFNPNNLNPSISITCNYTLGLQYVDTYTQQYMRNMQNEQTSLVDFISNFQPAPTSLTLKLRQGAISIQSTLYTLSIGLLQAFNSDISNVGC